MTFYNHWNKVIAGLLMREFQKLLSEAFRKKFFVGRYCKYKEWVSYFSAFMGNEPGWGSDKSSENRFAVHGICHVPRYSSFPMNAKKTLIPLLNAKYWNCFFVQRMTKGHIAQCPQTSQIIWYRAKATLRRQQIKRYTASKEGGVQNQWEHYIILTKYEAVHPTGVSENNSSLGRLII